MVRHAQCVYMWPHWLVDDIGVVDTGVVVVVASRYVCRLNIVLVWEAGGSC